MTLAGGGQFGLVMIHVQGEEGEQLRAFVFWLTLKEVFGTVPTQYNRSQALILCTQRLCTNRETI